MADVIVEVAEDKKSFKVSSVACKRCGYIWVPRLGALHTRKCTMCGTETPEVRVCPKCRSIYLDRVRTRPNMTGKRKTRAP